MGTERQAVSVLRQAAGGRIHTQTPLEKRPRDLSPAPGRHGADRAVEKLHLAPGGAAGARAGRSSRWEHEAGAGEQPSVGGLSGGLWTMDGTEQWETGHPAGKAEPAGTQCWLHPESWVQTQSWGLRDGAGQGWDWRPP